MTDEPIFIDPAELAGVDAETYQRADSGDRQAQKVMLRNLMTRQASPTALTMEHWTHWMLRAVATGASQAISDSLGSIAEAARQGQMSAPQETALNEMYEQHFGPDEVGEPASVNVRAAFAGAQPEADVIELFLLADRLASGATVDLGEVVDAEQTAAALDAEGAAAFFRAIRAQFQGADDPASAFGLAHDSVSTYADIAREDPIYEPKLGQTVLLASQIAAIAGEPQAGQLLQAIHIDAIEAFRAQEQGNGL